MSQLGTIPSEGNTYEWKNYRFEVMDMDANRVDKVLLTIQQEVSELNAVLPSLENER